LGVTPRDNSSMPGLTSNNTNSKSLFSPQVKRLSFGYVYPG
jgi:hypothetical protein